MNPWIWCDGRLMLADELRISPFDRGLTVGLGLFETLLAIDGRPVFADRHFARHAEGCRRLGWEELPQAVILDAMRKVLKANGFEQGKSRVRLYQTAGEGGLADLRQGNESRVLITVGKLDPAPDSLSLGVSHWVRNERSPLTGLKAASYAENLLALSEVRAAGFDEPLFLNTRGEVCETATANVFWVREGKVFTPPLASGCLPGITRGWLLESGRPRVEERVLSPADLESAEEVFLTSATRGVVPVSRLGDRTWKTPGDRTSYWQKSWETAAQGSL